MAALWWCSVLSLLAASQATSEERCSLWDFNCFKDVPFSYRYRNQVSYEECVTRNTKAWKIVSSCKKNAADALILKKSCACPASSIGSALAYEKQGEAGVKLQCLHLDDIKLSTCPGRVSQCKQHIETYVRSIEGSVGKGGPGRGKGGGPGRGKGGPGALFLQCNDAQKNSFAEVQKCISDAEITDLSGCGSIKYIVDQFLPLVKFMAGYVCSGCPVVRLVQGCLPISETPNYADFCRIIMSTSETTEILECVQTQMSSAPHCSSGTPLVPADLIRMTSNVDEIKSTKEVCKVRTKFNKEYASWNCSSNKRDSPTRWKRSSDSLGLVNLLSHFL